MRTLLFSIILVFIYGAMFAQTPGTHAKMRETDILTESFEEGFPYGWDITWEGSPIGHGNWIINEYTMHPYNHPPYDGGMLIYFDSFTSYPTFYARLETLPLDFSAFTTANLSFWMFHDDEFPDMNDVLIIQYRIGEGDWVSLDTMTRVLEPYNLEWVQHQTDLTGAVCGNGEVTIAFWGISAYGNDINIDLIEITGSSTAPEFVSIPEIEAMVEVVYTYNINVTDNGDISQLQIIAEEKPDWLSFTDYGEGEAILTGTPTDDDIGINPVLLRAIDDEGNNTTQPFDIDLFPYSNIFNSDNPVLLCRHPNPATEFVTIDISNMEGKSVNISIHNNLGQKVFELNNELIAGKNELTWHRTDQAGQTVAPGMYFIYVFGENQTAVNKVLLIDN